MDHHPHRSYASSGHWLTMERLLSGRLLLTLLALAATASCTLYLIGAVFGTSPITWMPLTASSFLSMPSTLPLTHFEATPASRRGTTTKARRFTLGGFWPPRHKPLAVADKLWQEYISFYSFLEHYSLAGNLTLLTDSINVCDSVPPALVGNIQVATHLASLQELDALDFFVQLGGHFEPTHCLSRSRVAIIIPFRNRWEHLAVWLLHMHPFLQKQQLSYTVYVINQEEGSKFNRGMLLNIGFKEARQAGTYDCYVFHDVDLLPENDNNLYNCPDTARHMSAAVDKFSYRLPYQWLIGGVLAITGEQFEKANGYSNLFFGWGGEDDDFAERLLSKGCQVTRYKPSVARYKMLKHEQDAGNEVNPERYRLLQRSHARQESDGLSSLQYSVKGTRRYKLFTWISVEIDQRDVFNLHKGIA